MEQPRLAYSVDEAARVAGIGRTKMFAEIRQRKITAKKVGRRTVISVADLNAWLNSLPSIQENQNV